MAPLSVLTALAACSVATMPAEVGVVYDPGFEPDLEDPEGWRLSVRMPFLSPFHTVFAHLFLEDYLCS